MEALSDREPVMQERGDVFTGTEEMRSEVLDV